MNSLAPQHMFDWLRVPWLDTDRPWFRAALLWLIVCLGLVLRLSALPLPGFEADLTILRQWGQSAHVLGIARSYREQLRQNTLPNYPPLSILLLEGTDRMHVLLQSNTDAAIAQSGSYIKVLPLFFDLLTIIALFLSLVRRGTWQAAGVSVLYALHPAVIYDSVVWGQIDTIFTFFVIASLGAYLLRPQWLWAPILLALGILSKPQAVMYLPLFIFITLPRPLTLLRALAIGTVVLAAFLLPIDLLGSGSEVLRTYTNIIGLFPAISSSAYNFWWSLYSHSSGTITSNQLFLGIAPYRTVGLVLFALAYTGILLTFRKRLWNTTAREASDFFLPAGLITYAFFLFNTEMHERYLFPAMALLAPLVLLRWRGTLLYAGLSLAFFMNLLGVMPFGKLDRAIYAEFQHFAVVIACAHLWLFGLTWYVAAQSNRPALRTSRTTRKNQRSRAT